MLMKTLIVMLALIAAATVAAAPPSTCGSDDDYSRALCAYQRREVARAEEGFRNLMEAGAEDPVTIKATYFLARTLMKRGRYAEAEELFMRIYGVDKAFYDAWNGDFLLGECRKALGKG